MYSFSPCYHRYVLMSILSEKWGGRWGEVGRNGDKWEGNEEKWGGKWGEMTRNGDRSRGNGDN